MLYTVCLMKCNYIAVNYFEPHTNCRNTEEREGMDNRIWYQGDWQEWVEGQAK